jgi:arylsulfatase A-like enzyme
MMATQANTTGKKPNILILWGDDIGTWNISYFSRGMMGYRTPNIDRVAEEGCAFTDYYGQQSCTAGRAAFITGQNPLRTGLTKVGMPGATLGLQPEDPTIAEVLKPLGYATGQFGKNHLGDRNEFLPTVHGFDEFFGNLYHLNAEEEPELPDYPKDPKFKEMFGPRGVLHCVATDKDDATEEPRWGRVGKQKIKDTGPLTKKRMETVDEEITAHALDWMEKQVKADKPFFLWYNSTACHMWTHLAEKNRGKSGQDDYSDRMVVHDEQIGQMLDKLDELGVAANTIVMYSTDNGPENDTWPDAANTPFRSQKDTNWEGAWRVPCFLRWPGKIKPGTVFNGIVNHQDMLPTLLAAAGDPDVSEKLKNGYKVGDKTFRVHIDGFNVLPYLTGEVKESPRNYFFYVSDDGDIMALRIGDYKLAFAVQRALSSNVWAEPFVKLRVPHIFHLRRDPFERAEFNSNVYWQWVIDHIPYLYAAQAIVQAQLDNFVKYPPRQKAASFNLDAVMAQLKPAIAAEKAKEARSKEGQAEKRKPEVAA